MIDNRSRPVNNPHFEAAETYLKLLLVLNMSSKIDEQNKNT